MENKTFWKFEHHFTLTSTNDYCIEAARQGCKTNLAVLADSQTIPRGSRGRNWVEPKGNLAFSLLYWPQFKEIKMNWISFVAALSLYDSVHFYSNQTNDLFIKWPNDLLYKNKKIAGILIECSMNPSTGLEWLVFGFGVNIKSYPELNRQLGCLQDFIQHPPSALELSKTLLYYYKHWISLLENNQEDFIREAWLQRTIPLNSNLTVRLGHQSWEGIYCGIDKHGLLLLQTGKELKHFSTGEVFLFNNSQDK